MIRPGAPRSLLEDNHFRANLPLLTVETASISHYIILLKGRQQWSSMTVF